MEAYYKHCNFTAHNSLSVICDTTASFLESASLRRTCFLVGRLDSMEKEPDCSSLVNCLTVGLFGEEYKL
jgi:hypothetical protein